MKTNILFRADGSNKMGLGHIVRSLALADMLGTTNYNCCFAVRNPSTAIISQIKNSCQKEILLLDNVSLLEEAQYLSNTHLADIDIVVLDGYHFTADYQLILKNTGCKVVSIDDIHDTPFVSDAIINHSGGISPKSYSKEKETSLYLGLDYVLLRAPFLHAAKNRETQSDSKSAFICLGGADPTNQIIPVLKKLEQSKSISQCHVIIGSAYKHREDLKNFQTKSALDIQIKESISAAEMVDIMRQCPIAITSPSTIAIEYLAVGGDLYLHPTADNQKHLNAYLLQSKVAFSFDSFPIKNKEKMLQAHRIQRDLLDGKSDCRLQKVFRQLDYEKNCVLRKATADDSMIYYDWVNDYQTRQQSFNSTFIPLNKHKNWFSEKINCSNSHLYLLEYKGTPVGQIRFEKADSALLSYSISPSFRGKGFGSFLLKKGIEKLQKEVCKYTPIVGYVKQKNGASNKAFLNLGFEQAIAEDEENTFKYSLQKEVHLSE